MKSFSSQYCCDIMFTRIITTSWVAGSSKAVIACGICVFLHAYSVSICGQHSRGIRFPLSRDATGWVPRRWLRRQRGCCSLSRVAYSAQRYSRGAAISKTSKDMRKHTCVSNLLDTSKMFNHRVGVATHACGLRHQGTSMRSKMESLPGQRRDTSCPNAQMSGLNNHQFYPQSLNNTKQHRPR
jgi:hypothetical protein